MAAREKAEYLPPRQTDEVGDEIGPVPEPQPVAGIKAWPRTSVESGTEVIIDGYGLFIPARGGNPELNAEGKVTFRGKTWDVDGVPGFVPGKGWIVYLKRVGS